MEASARASCLTRCLVATLFVACAEDHAVSPGDAPKGEARSTPDAAPGPSPVSADGAAPDAPDAGERLAVKPFGCADRVGSGHHVFTCDGFRFDVEVPAACAAGGCGLVLDVHGLTMDGEQEEASTKLRSVAASRDFVIVQPTAKQGIIGPSWNPSTDDEAVWKAVLDLRTAFAIDPRRVHVTGFSQGGAMSLRLLCKHADAIASIAPIAAADAQSLDSNLPPFRLDCPFDAITAPSRPTSILLMHGRKDGLVPIAKGRQQRDAILAWLGPTTATTVSEDELHERTRYRSASKDVVFEYLEHDYEVPPMTSILSLVRVTGHCIPGGDDLQGTTARPLYFTCAPPGAFVWGEVVLDFFDAHRLP